jgi:hypothetical protein
MRFKDSPLHNEGEQGTRPPVQPQLFDPLNLTEAASLNSLELGTLPGADPACIGRHAFEVLSLHALQRLAAEAGDARTGAPDDEAVVAWLFEDPSRLTAVRRYGRRLGHLIATLTVEPGPGSWAHGWRRAFLTHWLSLAQIWLAGGIVAGLGSDLLTAARDQAARLGSPAEIKPAPHPAELALIGAARAWPVVGRCSAVLDCGHTAVKRGIALADESGLRRLVLLPPCPTGALADDPSPEALASFVADCVCSTLEAARAHGEPDSLVRISLASYVRGGQPISPRGVYGRLPVQRLVAQVQARAGERFELRLGHDGTLAAAGLPSPGPRAGVIVVGTYLGSGFPPSPDTLLPLAPEFAIAPALPARRVDDV